MLFLSCFVMLSCMLVCLCLVVTCWERADLLAGELSLSGNHTVTEYEMSGKPYSQKSGLKNHTNELIFQVMTRFDQFMTR